jgi:hypothetical protein
VELLQHELHPHRSDHRARDLTALNASAAWATGGLLTTQCGDLWGNGGDLPGFSNEFFNSEDGKLQAAVIVNVNPIPKAVSGEPLGATKTTAIADALGREHC